MSGPPDEPPEQDGMLVIHEDATAEDGAYVSLGGEWTPISLAEAWAALEANGIKRHDA